MTTIAREGLERSVPFRSNEDTEETDGLTLNGYAAVFNQETEISSWEGDFSEVIAPGAFRKTIRERTPVMQFDHGRHPLIGSIPVGSITTLREDSDGLYVEGRMSDNWLIEPVNDAIRNKRVTGMSFRFDVIRDEWRDNEGKLIKDPEEIWRLLWDPQDRGPLKRTLKELRVHELGPVVFPAYAGTSVDLRAKAFANEVMRDSALVGEVRSALAMNRLPRPQGQLSNIGDTDFRRNVARAILFGDAPVEGHDPLPESRDVEEIYEPSEEDTHSEVVNDAPLRDEHPSKEEANENFRTQLHYARRRMVRRLGYISED